MTQSSVRNMDEKLELRNGKWDVCEGGGETEEEEHSDQHPTFSAPGTPIKL